MCIRDSFRTIDLAAFWAAFLVSFSVYCYTLAPTVTLEDSGELATAGAFLGVPHPPGYPIWTILAWVFTKIFFFVPYLGQPNPAWSIGLMSAFFGALASGITALLISRSAADILQATRGIAHAASPRTESFMCWAGGTVGSLLFAFSPINWSQSVIVEVYSLNAFFLVTVLLLAYMWIRRPNDRLLPILSLVFGIGLTNYQALLLLLPALIVIVLVRDLALFRDFIIAGIPYVIALFLINRGILPPVEHPTQAICYVYVTLNFVLIGLVWAFLPRGKVVALSILALQAGLAIYAYMPLSSETNPPMNWGYPRTWEGFKHALTRGQYEKITPTDVFSMEFVHQVGDYLQDLRAQFTLPFALLGFVPFTIWRMKIGRFNFNAAFAAILLSGAASAIILAEELVVPQGHPIISAVYKGIIAIILFLLLIGGMALFIKEAEELADRLTGRTPTSVPDRIIVAGVLLVAASLFFYCVFMLVGNLLEITAPFRKPDQAFTAGQAGTLVLRAFALILLIVGPVSYTHLTLPTIYSV